MSYLLCKVLVLTVPLGLRISAQYGNFYRRSTTDLEFGTLDADKAISVKLEHSRTLDDRQYAYLQCAVLHTTAFGQRRVRTCNLALQVASLVGNVFRYADMDATVCHLAREGECSCFENNYVCSVYGIQRYRIGLRRRWLIFGRTLLRNAQRFSLVIGGTALHLLYLHKYVP